MISIDVSELKAQIARRGMTRALGTVGISAALSKKINGKAHWTLKNVIDISNILGIQHPEQIFLRRISQKWDKWRYIMTIDTVKSFSEYSQISVTLLYQIVHAKVSPALGQARREEF